MYTYDNKYKNQRNYFRIPGVAEGSTDSLKDVVERTVNKKTTSHTENMKQTRLSAAKGKLLPPSK